MILECVLGLTFQKPKYEVDLQVIDAAMGGSSVGGAAHQATVTTVDQTQIITLQVGALFNFA